MSRDCHVRSGPSGSPHDLQSSRGTSSGQHIDRRDTVNDGMDCLSSRDYIVVDLETTGFAPQQGDRIVELAVLRCRPGAGVIDRFVTLVDPGRAVDGSHVHRIAAADVRGAPTFAAVAPIVRRQLSDGVIVAHNSRFDIAFLAAELGRAGLSLPEGPVLCTMGLASHLGVAVAGRSLQACCAFFDIALDAARAHGAEADAQATARLLLCLLREALAQGIQSTADLGCTAPPLVGSEPGGASTSFAAPPRQAAARLVTAVQCLADTSPLVSANASAYLDLLDRVLMDRVLAAAEVDALKAMACRCDLSEHETAAAHRTYLTRLVEHAWEDGVLTDAEASDLGAVGAMLGMTSPQIDDLVHARRATCRS